MIDFTIDTRIDRSPTDVFDYVTDPDKLATWQTNTVSAERQDEGPLRIGSRLREVHSGPGGRRFESVVEVAELDPGRAFALKVVEGKLPVDARITFEPRDSGTLMRFHGHGEATGAMRLAQPLVQRMLRRQFSAQCATLKQVMEGAG